MSRAHDEVDVVVVGAGVVGLATAAALAVRGRSVVVLERHPGPARELTSRNSGVIHAGLYYPPGSLKAELCRRGRELLYARCEEWRVPHRRVGKLVVATCEEEVPVLERLWATGTRNGAPGLRLIGADEVSRMEPDVRAVAALESPDTGIVDPHALALSFAAEAERAGASVVAHSEVVELGPTRGRWRCAVRTPDGAIEQLGAAAVVNAAGLEAHRVATLAGLDLAARGEHVHFCKGDYFALAPSAPLRVERLVYPVPPTAGLGIHLTSDLAGRVRFGPDAEYVEAPEYGVDPGKAVVFAEFVRRYLPAVRSEWLTPDQAGIRPRLAGPGEGFRDFVVREESESGLPGLVTCLGIESPGLTAAPAIAERIAHTLLQ